MMMGFTSSSRARCASVVWKLSGLKDRGGGYDNHICEKSRLPDIQKPQYIIF
jgi:hypothetical protein